MSRTSIKCSNEIYDQLTKKKLAMQSRVNELTGKKINVPYNKVLKVLVGTPIRISDKKLLRLVLKKKRRRN